MKDYDIEIIDTDATKEDMSDATWIKVRETMTMDEYKRRVKLGLVPDFSVMVLNPAGVLTNNKEP